MWFNEFRDPRPNCGTCGTPLKESGNIGISAVETWTCTTCATSGYLPDAPRPTCPSCANSLSYMQRAGRDFWKCNACGYEDAWMKWENMFSHRGGKAF